MNCVLVIVSLSARILYFNPVDLWFNIAYSVRLRKYSKLVQESPRIIHWTCASVLHSTGMVSRFGNKSPSTTIWLVMGLGSGASILPSSLQQSPYLVWELPRLWLLPRPSTVSTPNLISCEYPHPTQYQLEPTGRKARLISDGTCGQSYNFFTEPHCPR